MAKRAANELIEKVTVERMAAEGKCIVKHDERVVFVPFVAPGDVVDVHTTRKKKTYWEGRAVHFHQYAEERVEPFCEHFGVCGGCKWQHIPYPQQLAYKRQQVIDHFQRIAKVPLPEVAPTLGSEQITYYRNKLEFSFSDQRWLTREELAQKEVKYDRRALGFHMPGSFEKVLPINHCYLQDDPSNAIRRAIDAYAKANSIPYYNARRHSGILRTLMIRSTSTGEFMVVVQFGGDAQHDESQEVITSLLNHVRSTFPDLISLQYVINPKKNDTFHDLTVQLHSGQDYLTERMGDLQFRISAQSFYQTNSEQAHRLYEVARTMAQLTGKEYVYDLYSGTGTIANFIASQAQRVVGLEYVRTAVADARVNSEINGIENTQFVAGDIKDLLLPSLIEKHGRPDVVITDPPRNGMHPDVVKQLLAMASPRLVYISCNPATQARDVALLSEKYQVMQLQPVDMFPHTHHVENVALLELK